MATSQGHVTCLGAWPVSSLTTLLLGEASTSKLGPALRGIDYVFHAKYLITHLYGKCLQAKVWILYQKRVSSSMNTTQVHLIPSQVFTSCHTSFSGTILLGEITGEQNHTALVWQSGKLKAAM